MQGRRALALLIALAGAPSICGETPADRADERSAPIDLTAENYAAWRDHILPAEGELAWEQIPWHVTFHEGIAAASSARKPLLLWVMNGHPLGCT